MTARSPRRGFLRHLFRRQPAVPEQTFLGLQVVLAVGDEAIRRGLHEAIARDATTDAEKERAWRRLTTLLLDAAPLFDRAFVEMDEDLHQSAELFAQWTEELETNLALSDEETSDDVDGMHRLDAERGFMVVTMLVLLQGAFAEADLVLGDDDALYSRSGLTRVVTALGALDFGRVEADAAFIVPGSPEDGLSWTDLADEGWAYLVPVRQA